MKKEVQFCWIGSHKGIHLDYADFLARSSHNRPNITKSNIYYLDLLPRCKRKIKEQWSDYLTEEIQTGTTIFRHFYDKYSTKSCFQNMNFPRQVIQTIIRGSSNHTRLNDHLTRIKVKIKATCECGHQSQTFIHLLTECSKFTNERTSLLNALYRTIISKRISFQSLLFQPTTTPAYLIYSFFRKIKKQI